MLQEYALRIFGPDMKDDLKLRKDGNGAAARPAGKSRQRTER